MPTFWLMLMASVLLVPPPVSDSSRPASPHALERIGRLDTPEIREASGIVQSRRYPGVFWVHNDSGNAPVLFAVRADGSLLNAFRVHGLNVDWEDIAIDDEGHLYIGEIGNNENLLPVRAIYRVAEPDPLEPSDEPLPILSASCYRFPDRDRRFDAESLVVEGDRAILIAKTFDGREAEIFAVPLEPAAPLIRPAMVEPIGQLPGFVEPATGADLSASGRFLAVCSTRVTRVYHRAEIDRHDAWRLVGEVRYPPDGGLEAICWDGTDLILASEGRSVYRISQSAWAPRRRGPSP